MTQRNYRYRGRWNRRARNYVKLRGKKLAPVWVTNSRSCRESKRRYSWITVNGETWRYLNPRIVQGVRLIRARLEEPNDP